MQLHIDIYIWCAFIVFVFFKLASNVLIQGSARGKTKVVDYPEDKKDSNRLSGSTAVSLQDEPLLRATNLFRNDLENVVPFSLVALAAAFVQVDARLYILLLCVYAVARISHAVCLLGGKQPFRSASYLLGQFCSLVLVIFIIVRLIPIFQSY